MAILEFLKSKNGQALNLTEVERLAEIPAKSLYKAISGSQEISPKHIDNLAKILAPLGLKEYLTLQLAQRCVERIKKMSPWALAQETAFELTDIEKKVGLSIVECLLAAQQAYRNVYGITYKIKSDIPDEEEPKYIDFNNMIVGGKKYMIERRHDDSIYSIVCEFDPKNPDHYSDGAKDRTDVVFTEEQAYKINLHTPSVGVILTLKGPRVVLF